MIMNKKQEKISGVILNYLQRNPDAGDTLEGIVNWWMGFESIESSVEEVADILDGLIQERTITMHNIADGTTFYRYNKKQSCS